MKIYLIFLAVCAFMTASSAYSVYFDLLNPEKAESQIGYQTEDQYIGRLDSEQLFSAHIPPYVSRLNLKTGELKAFAGHSFQFIKAKCPAIPSEKIDNLGKYVSKLISKTDPTPERSPIVTELVTSLVQCAKDKVPDSKTPSGEDLFWKTVYFGTLEPAPIKKDDEAAPPADSGASTLPPQTDDIQISSMDTVSWSDSDSESDSSPSSSWNLFKWLGGIFNSMKKFTEKLFGIGSDSDAARNKRDVLADQSTEEAQGNDEKSVLDNMNSKLIPDPLDRKDAFFNFFDNLCRIYCAQCPHSFPTGNFKAAAKELLEFILKDESGSKLAAEHYLDNAVLQAFNDC